MKKIEKRMIEAINNKKNFEESNTRVKQLKSGFAVYLFGNPIFCKINGKTYWSNCGWNTATTSSRLRALGVDYSTAANFDRSAGLSFNQIWDKIWHNL